MSLHKKKRELDDQGIIYASECIFTLLRSSLFKLNYREKGTFFAYYNILQKNVTVSEEIVDY